MSIAIDYDKLAIEWEFWDDAIIIDDLLNEMNNNNFKWLDENWNNYFKKYYGLNINAFFSYDHGIIFANNAEMQLFILNFL